MARILIIDDDVFVRDQIQLTLTSAFYEAFTAVDGLEGVRLARSLHPNLIICDILMPNMDGLQVLTELRRHVDTESIPFIFLSAIDDHDTLRASMNLGANDYLSKPFQVIDLLHAVEARLSQHEKLLSSVEQQIDAIKIRLAHTVTHELRTPVGLILGSVQMLECQGDPAFNEMTRDMIGTMSRGATRLAHVVEQMVYATHITSGLYSAEMVTQKGMIIDIGDILHGAHKSAHRFTIRQPVNLEVKLIEHPHPIYVKAEPDALKHAIAEVISNAIAFSAINGVVYISCRPYGSEVRITITDNGNGFAETELPQAMSWFGQIDRETQEQQGLGLGLPLANQLIAIHGGKLDIHSIVGKGTQAIITLPSVVL